MSLPPFVRVVAGPTEFAQDYPPRQESLIAELVRKLGLGPRRPQLVGGGQFIGHNMG